jgi:hypothetical protein
VPRPHVAADQAELRRLVSEARAGLARSSAELEGAISATRQERARLAAAVPSWTAHSDPASVAAPGGQADIDLDRLTAEAARATRQAGGGPAAAHESAELAAEADAIIEEFRLRCPRADLTELTRLRSELGAGGPNDRGVVQDLRVRAARGIQRVKRLDALEAQRQRLFVLAEDAAPDERAELRRRVADAPPEDVPNLDHEVTAAVSRASAERSRAEAVSAVELSLRELGYDVQGGFDALLPASAPQPAPRFLVVASPHSADHGLRVRVGADQLYLSVVRRAGTAGPDSRAADTSVQERTCADLADVTTAAAGHGVHIILGNAQAPGGPAPEVGAEHWPASIVAAGEAQARSDVAADSAEQRRRRAWAAQEQARMARPQVRTRRPGS